MLYAERNRICKPATTTHRGRHRSPSSPILRARG